MWMRAVGNGSGGGDRLNQKFAIGGGGNSTPTATPMTAMIDERGASVMQSQSLQLARDIELDIPKNVGQISKEEARIKEAKINLKLTNCADFGDTGFESLNRQ